MIDELVNDYTLMGDDGAVIFASFDHLLEFVEKIRADEREACAKVCENIERNGAWITKTEAAAAIREGVIMTDLRKAAEQALESLELVMSHGPAVGKAIEVLRQALAQPVDAVNISQERVDETAKREHEPVAWLWKNIDGHQVLTDDPDYADGTWTPLYTAPPKKEWVGLTDEEVINCFDSVAFGQVEDDLIINKHVNIFTAIHYIEAKLKEKNT